MTTTRRALLGALGITLMAFSRAGISAQPIATCSEAEGYAYYHHTLLVLKAKSGFEKDKIGGGLFTIQLLDNGEYDVLFVDVRKRIISFKQDGGFVQLVRKGASDATFLLIFPGMVIELYTIYVDASGAKKFDLLQSKGGDGMPVHKSSVMTGLCSEMNLQLLR